MDVLTEVLWMVVKASGMGAVSFLVQRILASLQNRLELLCSKSQLSEAEEDMKELLTHFDEEVGSFSCPDVSPKRVIEIRLELALAYWRLRFQALLDTNKIETK